MRNFDNFSVVQPSILIYGLSSTQLLQIRDNLLDSLISQLSFNKKIPTPNPIPPIKSPHFQQIPQKPSQKKLELTHCHSTTPQLFNIVHPKFIQKSIKQKQLHHFIPKNDTKNIPKNFGKAILRYIIKSPKTRKLTNKFGIPFTEFLNNVNKIKKQINSIQGLKQMWGSNNIDNTTKKCIRILSYDFMRKYCLNYIFHSKVRNYRTHIKYRQNLIEGLQNPTNFNHIKDF